MNILLSTDIPVVFYIIFAECVTSKESAIFQFSINVNVSKKNFYG